MYKPKITVGYNNTEENSYWDFVKSDDEAFFFRSREASFLNLNLNTARGKLYSYLP